MFYNYFTFFPFFRGPFTRTYESQNYVRGFVWVYCHQRNGGIFPYGSCNSKLTSFTSNLVPVMPKVQPELVEHQGNTAC